MRDAWMLCLALLGNLAGLAWIALSMKAHWKQVHATRPLTRSNVLVFRTLGAIALISSLSLCLAVDHISMASLVWIMSVAAAAFTIAFVLARKPRALAIFAPDRLLPRTAPVRDT